MEGCEQFRLNDGGDQRAEVSVAMGDTRNVVWRVGWEKHFVDDVNHAVTGVDVGRGHVGAVDKDPIVAHGEGEGFPVDGGGSHAVRKC